MASSYSERTFTYRSDRRRHHNKELTITSSLQTLSSPTSPKASTHRNQRPLQSILHKPWPRSREKRWCRQYRGRHTSLDRILDIPPSHPVPKGPHVLLHTTDTGEFGCGGGLDRVGGMRFDFREGGSDMSGCGGSGYVCSCSDRMNNTLLGCLDQRR